MKIYLLGGEQSTQQRLLREAGAKHVGLSFHSLLPRIGKRKEWLVAEKFSDQMEVYLASGGHAAAKKLSAEGISQYLEKFESFVERNAFSIALCTEFDGPLSPVERTAHRLRMLAMLDNRFIPVWLPASGPRGLDVLAEAYQTIGVFGSEVKDNRALSSKMVPLTNRLGTRWHALDGARPDDMLTGRFVSAATTGWLSPMRYGETIVWDGTRMVRYQTKMKDQARRRHRSTFRQAGFDAEAILNDNHEEISRFTVWSYARLEDAVTRRNPEKNPEFSDSTPSDSPEIPDLSTSTGWNEPGNTVEDPPVDVDNSHLVVRNSAQVPTKREERQLLPGITFEIKTSTEFDVDGKQVQVDRRLLKKSSAVLRQCDTCLVPETPVLMADFSTRAIGDLIPGDVVLGFDESGRRKYKPSVVQATKRSVAPTLTVSLESGRQITATADHRWLRKNAVGWGRTNRLTPNTVLRSVAVDNYRHDDEFRRGYIAGMTKGDGTIRATKTKPGSQILWWRVALTDLEPLHRLQTYLTDFGYPVEVRPYDPGRASRTGVLGIAPKIEHKPMHRVEFRAGSPINFVASCDLDSGSPEWAAGYLSGFFDAEGSFDGFTVRLAQMDTSVLEMVMRLGRRLGFDWVLETYENGHCPTARLLGGMLEALRFFTATQPAIKRKTARFHGRSFITKDDRVLSVVPGPVTEVVDIQTSTDTFIANGVATHNCHIAATCPGFLAAAECAYDLPVEIKTKEQVLAANYAMLEMQVERIAFMRLAEEQSGGYADPNLSQEIDRLFAMQVDIKKIEDNAEYIKINMEARGGAGVLSRLLGEKTMADQRPAPQQVETYIVGEIE